MFSNLSVKKKIIIPVSIIILLFSSSSIINILASRNQTQISQTIQQHYLPSLFTIEDAYRDLYQATSAVQALVLASSSDEIEQHMFEYKDNAYKALPRMKSTSELVRRGLLPLHVQSDIDELINLAEVWLASYEAFIILPPNEWQAHYEQNKHMFDRQFVDVRAQLNVVKDIIDNVQLKARAQNEAAITQAETTLTIGTVLVLLFSIISCRFLISSIVNPIENITKAMDEIASGDGDLSKRISTDSEDEIGRLGTAFNQFANKIQVTIEQVMATTSHVRQEMGQLAGVAQSISQATNQQQQESELVATAVNQMQMTSLSVKDNANDAAATSAQADQEVHSASLVIGSTVESIKQLASDVDNASKVIHTLDKDVADIASILDVICGIAEQTNLLALNAAIEAARAGEQGRGFAVVADEVRSLASRTQQSTGQIQSMIERLQAGAEEAVRVMRESKTSSEETIDNAQSASQSLQSILSAIGQINAMNTNIAAAAEQQSTVSEEVNENIQKIAENSVVMVDTVESAERSLTSLAEQCSTLDQLVSQFKC